MYFGACQVGGAQFWIFRLVCTKPEKETPHRGSSSPSPTTSACPSTTSWGDRTIPGGSYASSRICSSSGNRVCRSSADAMETIASAVLSWRRAALTLFRRFWSSCCPSPGDRNAMCRHRLLTNAKSYGMLTASREGRRSPEERGEGEWQGQSQQRKQYGARIAGAGSGEQSRSRLPPPLKKNLPSKYKRR